MGAYSAKVAISRTLLDRYSTEYRHERTEATLQILHQEDAHVICLQEVPFIESALLQFSKVMLKVTIRLRQKRRGDYMLAAIWCIPRMHHATGMSYHMLHTVRVVPFTHYRTAICSVFYRLASPCTYALLCH